MDCEEAIGKRDGTVRKPTWGGFFNRKDAEKCLEIVQHVEFTSRFANPQRAQAAAATQQPPPAPIAQQQVNKFYSWHFFPGCSWFFQ
jgi:hypothetical protein